MKIHRHLGLAVTAALLLATAAFAQPVQLPLVTSIGPGDAFQDVVGGIPNAQSQYAPSALLGNYGTTIGGNNPENVLIGGDATTNLWQRATTGSSVTTTITYGGPDRWAYWSGTSTAMTVSRDSTAAQIPAQYQYGFKMARTSGQTGVVQMCMMQEVESFNSYALAGQTAEIDFHAYTGANFSAAAQNMTVYLISGTGTDEGVSKAAFNLNAGGGGSSLWTGQVNTGVVVSLQAVSTLGRYTAAIPVPAAATELAVALCYTPVGTAGTNDFVEFSGIQLTRNSSLTGVAGTAGVALPANDLRAKAFARRSQALETVLQQRYYWQWAETASSTAVSPFMCQAQSSTVAVCMTSLHTTLRATPTIACTAGTLKRQVAGTDTTVSACAAAATTNGISGVDAVAITATVASGDTAGFASLLMSGNSTGGGLITASAEF